LVDKESSHYWRTEDWRKKQLWRWNCCWLFRLCAQFIPAPHSSFLKKKKNLLNLDYFIVKSKILISLCIKIYLRRWFFRYLLLYIPKNWIFNHVSIKHLDYLLVMSQILISPHIKVIQGDDFSQPLLFCYYFYIHI